MQTVELNVVKRDPGVRQNLKTLRAQGLVPANLYGPGSKNHFFAFSEKEVRKLFNNDFSATRIINLKSDDVELKGKKAVLKSLERDPLSWKLMHADLYEVTLAKPLAVSLPIHFVGTPTGVKDSGGILNILRRSVKVRGLLTDLPEAIEVDISKLGLSESIHIGQVKFPEKLTILDSADFTLAAVVEAEKEEAAAPVAAAAATADAGTGVAAAASTAAAAAPAGDKKAEKKAEPAKGK